MSSALLLWSVPGFCNSLPNLPLSVALKKHVTGIRHDDLDKQGWTQLTNEAKAFIRYRHRKMSKKERAAWEASCSAQPDANVFCDFLDDRVALRRALHHLEARQRSLASRSDLFALSDALSQGKISKLEHASLSQLHRITKLFPRWEVLEPAVEQALSQHGCPNPALLVVLGQKGEEFFPAEKIREQSEALYARAVQCGADGEAGDQARYRLSLLKIWDGKCKEAEPDLLALSGEKDGEYSSRALYWRYSCAKTVGDEAASAKLKAELLKEYPLSYHALIVSLDRLDPVASVESLRENLPAQLTREPLVELRSELRPELNPYVRAVEALESLHADDLARDVLEAILEAPHSALVRTESGFKLYLAVLFDRSGDTIGRFRSLAAAFHEDPAVISKASLELFYPLHRFNVLRRFGSKVDPYLVTALIRQESGFNERARSPAGALGLMQLMPQTARKMERVRRVELYDAKTNVRLGVKYFQKLLKMYKYDAELALAAYNAGPEKVDDWLKRYPVSNRTLFVDLIPFRETRGYVSTIARNYYWYLSLYSHDDDPLVRVSAESSGRSPAYAKKQRILITGFARK